MVVGRVGFLGEELPDRVQGWLGRAWGVDVEVSWMVRKNLQGVSRMIPPLQAWWGWLVRLLFVESR